VCTNTLRTKQTSEIVSAKRRIAQIITQWVSSRQPSQQQQMPDAHTSWGKGRIERVMPRNACDHVMSASLHVQSGGDISYDEYYVRYCRWSSSYTVPDVILTVTVHSASSSAAALLLRSISNHSNRATQKCTADALFLSGFWASCSFAIPLYGEKRFSKLGMQTAWPNSAPPEIV